MADGLTSKEVIQAVYDINKKLDTINAEEYDFENLKSAVKTLQDSWTTKNGMRTCKGLNNAIVKLEQDYWKRLKGYANVISHNNYKYLKPTCKIDYIPYKSEEL